MEPMKIRVIDFETTGQPPEAEVVEAAYQDVILTPPEAIETLNRIEVGNEQWPDDLMGSSWASLVRNENWPVSIEARAAHHISDVEINERGISWDEARVALVAGSPDLYCAHNANFEREFFDAEGLRWLDTLKIAYRLFEDAPSFSNQGLRYFLEQCDPGQAGMPPHRALPDCVVTARILVRCLRAAPLATLLRFSEEPAMPPTIRFGKHRGKKWCDAPADYLRWMLRQDFDDDVKHCARTELARRPGGK